MIRIIIYVCTVVLLINNPSIVVAQAVEPAEVAKALSSAFESAASKITPSLVSVNSLKRFSPRQGGLDPRLDPFRDFLGDELFRKHFGLPPQGSSPNQPNNGSGPLRRHGLGSGFIISSDGYVLTNNHVIDGSDAVKVKLDSGRELDAKVVGTDPQTDIAVLKIEGSGFTPVDLGDSDSLAIGEWVVAAGNPFGLDRTITAGIVSARGRAVSRGDMYEDFIQTDAAINVGNSGGPLLNLEGQVVGINTMIVSGAGGNQGIGFAIPINMAKNISEQLIESGSVTRGWLGIAIQDLTQELKDSFSYDGYGVLVGDVNSGGPADKGGLEPGDIIISINETTTETANDLRNLVASMKPGSNAKLSVYRSGKRLNIDINLGKRTEDSATSFNKLGNGSGNLYNESLGLRLDNLSPDTRQQLGFKTEGNIIVVDVNPNSLASVAGLRPGDIILKINDKNIESVESFNKLVDSLDLSEGFRLVVENRGLKRFVIIKR